MRAMSLMVTLSIFFVFGCGGDDTQSREEAIEAQVKKYGIDADVKVDADGNVDAVKFEQGGVTVGNNLKLPNGFPTDVPVGDEWQIISSAATPQGGHSLQALTSGDMNNTVATLRQAYSEQGWEEKGFQQPATQMTSISFGKDDRMTNINLIDQGGPQMSVQLLTMKHP